MLGVRGRKPLSVGMKQTKQNFDKQLKSYSATALKNIISIAENSFDVNVRLKANQYILDRCYGRDYKAVVQEQKEQNIETHMTLTVINPRNKIDMNNLAAELEQSENTIDTEDEDWTDYGRRSHEGHVYRRCDRCVNGGWCVL